MTAPLPLTPAARRSIAAARKVPAGQVRLTPAARAALRSSFTSRVGMVRSERLLHGAALTALAGYLFRHGLVRRCWYAERERGEIGIATARGALAAHDGHFPDDRRRWDVPAEWAA